MVKHNLRLWQVFIMGAVLIVLQACNKEDLSDLQTDPSTSLLKSKTTQTFYGPTVPVGNGVARAWILQEKDGTPLAVGVTLSEKALQKLPDHMEEFVLDLPDHAGSNFYTHATLDWNPGGHEPPGVYDLPHFDVHFYIIPLEERLAIGPDDDTEFANAPAPIFQPPLYLHTPGGIPQMGAHWIDLLAPEFSGGIFTRTFIWGSYDGEFIFWEPMVTRDYLMSQPDEEIALRLPDYYQREGWYATHYKISYSTSPGQYIIALTGLTYRPATPVP